MNRYFIFLLIVFFTGCSSARVLHSEKADDADLSSYKTFDFYKVEASGDTLTQQFNERIAKLEDAIALEMQKYGYLLSKTNPDLLVNIGIAIQEEVQTRRTDFRTDAPRYIGQRRYSWKSEEIETGRYKEGTVTIHLVDSVKNKMVWKGAVQGILPEKEEKLESRIRKGIQKLFKEFPGRSKPL
jgi:hypothetical protein